ncbi:MAG: GNAT family N-acetyltransferase [Ancrocorticia sp.]
MNLSIDPLLPPMSAAKGPSLSIKPLASATREQLARLYLSSYPPEVGTATLSEARQEIEESFAGTYGVLRDDASGVATVSGRPIGAIMVTERSIWDEGLLGPFVIDLFVAPEARGNGAGAMLVGHAVEACRAAGDSKLSLRIGEGTSPAAHAIYSKWGFTPA